MVPIEGEGLVGRDGSEAPAYRSGLHMAATLACLPSVVLCEHTLGCSQRQYVELPKILGQKPGMSLRDQRMNRRFMFCRSFRQLILPIIPSSERRYFSQSQPQRLIFGRRAF